MVKLFRTALPIAALLACVLSPAAAEATWPGKPGLVAYWDLAGLHTIRPDGTHDRLVFEHMTGNLFAWSPNGRELGLGGSDVLWRARPDGTHSRVVVNRGYGRDNPDVLSPAWGPKGDRLVFTAAYRHYGDPPEHINPTIWSVRRNGTHLRKLARGTEAVWSRSGAHIRFIDEDNDIVQIKANGRGRRVLARNSAQTRSLDLSPGGNRLVYQTGSDGNPVFHTLNVRNGARTQFSIGKFEVREVVWAPGGERLAYLFRPPNHQRVELWTIRPNGKGMRKVLTFPESYWVHDLAWQTR